MNKIHHSSCTTSQNLNLEGVNNKDQLVSKLLKGRNDYFILDYADGLAYLKENELLNKIIPLPYPITKTDIHFLLSRKSSCENILPEINRVINEVKNDGTLQSIIDKYVK